MITPEALIAQAREWLGVRFRHQGRTRFGADCSGYIAGVLGELGCDVGLKLLPANYARDPKGSVRDMLPQITREIPLQPAAALLIHFPFTPYASHLAIYTGSTILHALATVGKVVEIGYQEPWIKRTESIWALPGVSYQ